MQNEEPVSRPKSELIVQSKQDNKSIKGVSGRFNPSNDINSLKSYAFVGPAST